LKRNFLLPIVFSALFLLSACGGTRAELHAVSNNKNVVVTVDTQKSLSSMESEMFVSKIDSKNCSLSASQYKASLLEIINTINSNSEQFVDIRPPFNSVALLEAPPREEETVAIFACDGLDADVFTLNRSIFISNSFIDELQNESLYWNDQSLFIPALSYIIYHELGHALLNHSAIKLATTQQGQTYSFDLPEEMEADSFAYDLMTLTEQNLMGMVMAQSLVSRR